jgi:hypothetical protein
MILNVVAHAGNFRLVFDFWADEKLPMVSKDGVMSLLTG